MSHLIWKGCIEKLSSHVLCFQALQGRLAFYLQDFLLDLENAESALSKLTKQYQSLSGLKEQEYYLPALFFVLITHSSMAGPSRKKKVTTKHWKCDLQGKEYFTFCLAPQQLAALNTNLPHLYLMCSGTAEGVSKTEACCVPPASVFCVKGKKQAAQN